jgi:hypothetical protein
MIKNNTLQPTLHKPVPLQTRVIVPVQYLGADKHNFKGIVAGIATVHVIFTYIILLDEPIVTNDGLTSAIIVDGPNLMDEDGVYAWRLSKCSLDA